MSLTPLFRTSSWFVLSLLSPIICIVSRRSQTRTLDYTHSNWPTRCLCYSVNTKTVDNMLAIFYNQLFEPLSTLSKPKCSPPRLFCICYQIHFQQRKCIFCKYNVSVHLDGQMLPSSICLKMIRFEKLYLTESFFLTWVIGGVITLRSKG